MKPEKILKIVLWIVTAVLMFFVAAFNWIGYEKMASGKVSWLAFGIAAVFAVIGFGLGCWEYNFSFVTMGVGNGRSFLWIPASDKKDEQLVEVGERQAMRGCMMAGVCLVALAVTILGPLITTGVRALRS